MKHPCSMQRQLHVRLFLMGFLGIFLGATVCIAIFQKVWAEQIWTSLEQSAHRIAAVGQKSDSAISFADFADESLRITLTDPQGEVLYDSAANTNENHSDRPEIRQAAEEGIGKSVRDSSTLGSRTYYCAVRLQDGRVLRVSRQAEGIWLLYYDALPAVLTGCLAILLLSGLLSGWFTRKLIRPITAMSQDLDHIQQALPYTELAPMALAIHSDRLLLQNNEKLRQEFTANVSHELKTPLTSISGYAELITSGLAKPEDVPRFAQKIHSEAARMIALVNDILALSRLDDMQQLPQQMPVFEELDLALIAKQTAERLRMNARSAYVVLHTATDSAPVRGDAQMLAELCQNLCDNAIRYNRPGGRVDLITGENAWGKPYLKVCDNGIGIAPEAKPHIFERFYRVDKSRSKATGGTGLGLAIVKHIALLHHASITLDSEPNEGTTITVTFDPI